MPVGFEQFRARLYPSRDGLDLSILDKLTASEREAIEALSIASLTPDAIDLIAALGHLRSQKAFVPLLELLPQTTGTSRVYVAEALWRIKKYEPALSTLCQALMPGSLATKRARVLASIVLGSIPEEPAINALEFAIKDDDSAVRYHAWRSLAHLLGPGEKLWALDRKRCDGSLSSREREMTAKEYEELIRDVLRDYANEMISDETWWEGPKIP